MNVKRLREDRELTQQQVADMIGVDVATYNRYERGKYKIKKTVRVALSAVFNVNVEDINID